MLQMCTQMYSEGCECGNIAWVLGSKVLPCSNSSRSMALDNLLLPTLFSVQQWNAQKKKGIAPKWCVKSMIKHFHRHKRQPVVFSHVKKKKEMKLPHCWNPLISPMAAWKKEALENKNTSETSTFFRNLSQVVSCFYFLFTIAELALVN